MGVATVSTQEHLTTKLAVSELYMFQFTFECLWCMCEDNTSNNDNSKHDELQFYIAEKLENIGVFC